MIMKGIGIFVLMQYGFVGLMLFIDIVVYWIAGLMYGLFVGLSQVTILTNEAYQNLADRIYVLVGIVGLFVMTFTLLKAMVDPDKAGQTVIKSFKSLIISVALVILLPTIFKYAFSFQNAIIKDGVIHNIFNFRIDGKSNGTEKTLDEVCSTSGTTYEVLDEDGNPISTQSTNSKSNVTRTVQESTCEGNYIIMELFSTFFIPKKEGADPVGLWHTKWSDAKAHVAQTGNFFYITTFVPNLSDFTSDNGMWYIFLVSTAAGAFAAYVLLSFCIDLGIRAFKLAFYEIIAPIPIFLRIIPGKDSYFNKWVSATVKCFLEIFVRILLIEFMVFMFKNFAPILDTAFSGSGQVGLMGKAILILGLLSFIKQAPKLFKDALGFEGAGVKLGLKGKLEEGTALPRQAAAVVGGTVTAGVQSGVHGVQRTIDNINKAPGGLPGKIGAGVLSGLGAIGGTVAGIGKGAGMSIDAVKENAPKNMKEVAYTARKAAQDAQKARSEREAFLAKEGGYKGAATNLLRSMPEKAKNWVTGSSGEVIDRVKAEEEYVGLHDGMKNLFNSNQYSTNETELAAAKSAKASGTEYNGKSGAELDKVIQRLEGNLLAERAKAISKNTSGYAYQAKQIVDQLKADPKMAEAMGLNGNTVDNLIKAMDKYHIAGNKVVDSSDNEIKADDLMKIVEGEQVTNDFLASYDISGGKVLLKGTNTEVTDLDDFENIGSIYAVRDKSQGIMDTKKPVKDKLNTDKNSIEYKENLKRQDKK